MNLRLTAVALAALLVGGSLAWTVLGGGGRSGQLSKEIANSGKPLVGGPFSLSDPNGKRVTDKDFRGRYLLVFFGYTFCPDVCPAALQVIGAALDQLGPEGEQIAPVLISIDPARDTPEKMGAYVKSFHPRMIGLTGSPEETAAAVKAYRVYAKKVPDDRNPSDYTMDHTSVVYLMGPDGNLVTFSAEITKADVLADQLRRGLAKRFAS
jgi:cytochrome oxidase Cu insertion factor (SCO1/SenC/PrrC family)